MRVRWDRRWILVPSRLTAIDGWQGRDGEFPRMYGEHVCSCCKCDPELEVEKTRQSLNHFGVAIGDEVSSALEAIGSRFQLRARSLTGHDARLHVYFRDIEWPYVVEVFVGPGGKAVCHSSPPHLCRRCMVEFTPGPWAWCTYAVESDEFSVRSGPEGA